MIVLVAALPQEISGIVKRYALARTETDPLLYVRTTGSPPFAAVSGGVGRDAMTRACRFAFQSQGPSVMVSVGFAGGLDPSLETGDAVIASGFMRAEEGKDLIRPETQWVEQAEAAAQAADIPYRLGAFLESDTCLGTPEMKDEARKKYGAAAVEMESYAVAEFAREHGVPFLGVRFISDGPNDTLDIDPAAFVYEDGRFSMAKTLKYLLRDPKRLSSAMRLGKAAKKCDRNLQSFIEAFLRTWA